MVKTTDDLPGDLCSHARSQIIQAITLKTPVLEASDEFYIERGAVIHSVEVRSIQCKDLKTQETLQKIIQETTNRLSELLRQESQNEILLKKIQGDKEAEQMRKEFLLMREENQSLEGKTAGLSEACKVKALFEGLGENMSGEQKLQIFMTLRKLDMIDKISAGNSHLYFTPNDVDLSIETRTPGSGR